jgi:putative phosphoribosyl transferase
MFRDRVDAGRQLAEQLRRFASASDAVVLGIPRGGVVVAAEVARALKLPLDIVIAAKVGAPGNPEFAAGALTADGELLANPDLHLDPTSLEGMAADAKAKVARLLGSLRGSAPELPLVGRTAIIVDDGLATGLTAKAAARFVRRQGAAHIVLAVPVAAPASAAALSDEVDELAYVELPAPFAAVGQFYTAFDQVSDDEVRSLLSGRSPDAQNKAGST